MLDLENLKRFRDFKFEILKLVPEWSKAYQVPEEAVMRQIPIAHAWCNANPKKAPKKDPVRFLNNWMRIASKMGNLVARQADMTFREHKPEEEEIMDAEDFRKLREALKK